VTGVQTCALPIYTQKEEIDRLVSSIREAQRIFA